MRISKTKHVGHKVNMTVKEALKVIHGLTDAVNAVNVSGKKQEIILSNARLSGQELNARVIIHPT